MLGISISPKRLDAWLVGAHVFIALAVVTGLHLPVLAVGVYLFGVPTAYLAWRAPKAWRRDLLGAVLVGPVFGLMFEAYGGANGLWTYHDQWFVLPRLGTTPVDILVWSFVWALCLIFLYEHFWESGVRSLSSAYVPMLLFVLVGTAYLLTHQNLFMFADAYLWWGLFSLWPVAAAWYWRRPFFLSILPVAALGLLLGVAFEWASCTAGYWTFGAQYIGFVTLAGCRLPTEEVVFWVIAAPLLGLCNFLLFVKRG